MKIKVSSLAFSAGAEKEKRNAQKVLGCGARGMARRLRVFVVCAELGLLPSTHKEAHNHVSSPSRASETIFGLLQA